MKIVHSILLTALAAAIGGMTFMMWSCSNRAWAAADSSASHETSVATESGAADSDSIPGFKMMIYDDEIASLPMEYQLYVPEDIDAVHKYPLVVVVDGHDVASNQHEALAWTASALQKEIPCYVLVPKFTGSPFEGGRRTLEADIAIRMIDQVAKANQVKHGQIYIAARGEGVRLMDYYTGMYPDLFMASLNTDGKDHDARMDIFS